MSTHSNALRRTALFAGIALVAGGLGAWVSSRRYEIPAPANENADWFYSLDFDNAQGQRVAMTEHRNKILLINFWATWCPPCIEEMPDIDAVRQKHRGHGFETLGIGIDNPENIQRFAQERPVSYPLLVAGSNGTELAKKFGNATGALPFSVLVAANGDLIARKLGKISTTELESWIDMARKTG